MEKSGQDQEKEAHEGIQSESGQKKLKKKNKKQKKERKKWRGLMT